MAKLTLTNLSSLVNEQSAIGVINSNNDRIETALENTLSRDGTSPNNMNNLLDMNSNKIINLVEPTSNTEPVRNGEFLLVKAGVDALVNSLRESMISEIGSRAAGEIAEFSASVSYVRTSGYYEAGDKGGALYKRVVSEPSHGGKFQSGDGAWWEIAEPIVNAKQFGAKGDGVTNDYTSLQNAINFGFVYIPQGTYLINSTLVIPNKGKIYGAGVEQTNIVSGVIGGSLFKTSVDTTFVVLCDMSLTGNNLTGSSGNGHAINFIDPVSSGGTFSPQQAVLERLRIKNFRGQDIRRTGVATTIMSAGS
jgi:hypothetical protein